MCLRGFLLHISKMQLAVDIIINLIGLAQIFLGYHKHL